MRVIPSGPDFAHLERLFLALGRIGEDLTPLMRQAAAIMHGATEDAFAQERSPDGKSWAQLAESTARKLITKGRLNKRTGKRSGGKRRGRHPILQLTGRLAASITTRVTRESAEIGTNVIYAAIHQFGGNAGRGLRTKIPARAYIGLSSSNAQEIEKAAVSFISTKITDLSGNALD